MWQSKQHNAWGDPSKTDQESQPLWWQHDPLPQNSLMLPRGNARSYGDSCQNHSGVVIDTTYLNRFLDYDKDRGIIHCESGTLLKDILALVVKDNWFLPVVPGTQLITVGGAIANDIHGKNHPAKGSFGDHVLAFQLRQEGSDVIHCSSTENPDLFSATIGGLGLTGLITSATIQLKSIPSPWMAVETIPFNSLETVLELLQSSQQSHEYNVAWIDCLNQSATKLRGIFHRSNFVHSETKIPDRKNINIPCYFPRWVMNKFTIKNFNRIIYYKNKKNKPSQLPYHKFLFPLDNINHWNRIYGKPGLLQYQGVIPYDNGKTLLKELFHQIIQSQQASFLCVLKCFGEQKPKGLLSFPMSGFTLALDFPNRGKKTIDLLHCLYKITLEADGRIYPAKDSCLTPEMFQQGFSHIEQFSSHIHGNFTSDFWQRITGNSVSCKKTS